ncbi:MAG: M28 family peptidase [Gemmatimonadetes bacterium]|nr:M28 family peptidase [Gemmatimonadota bacterium]
MTLRFTSWLLLALLAAAAPAPPLAAQALDSITPQAMRRHITRLAADSMRGRATPSRELDQAARYAAAAFRRAGLVPIGDSGTFLQRYKILTTRLVPESSTVRMTGPRPASWRLGREVDWLRGSEVSPAVVSGHAVVLTGLPDSADPFGGLDVRGAVIIHLANMTPNGGVEAPLWLFRAAAHAGVVGWIQVVQRDSADWHRLVSFIREPRTFVSGSKDVIPFPVVEMLDGTMGAFLAEAGVDQAALRPLPNPLPPPLPLAGYTVRLRLVERVRSRRTAPNVLGLLPGADTAQSGHLLVAAHLDGLGVDRPIGSDSIYNGADDNASGVAAVLEAARALGRGPRPPRSILFALFSGTERRLWGSAFYLAHPAVPLEQTAGMINVESIGRNLKDSLAVILGPVPTPLEAAVERAARAHAAELGITVVTAPNPKLRLWLQGDHALFFGRGIPILYLHNGAHGDLHKPGDEPHKIDVVSTARIARFLVLLAREAATATP